MRIRLEHWQRPCFPPKQITPLRAPWRHGPFIHYAIFFPSFWILLRKAHSALVFYTLAG